VIRCHYDGPIGPGGRRRRGGDRGTGLVGHHLGPECHCRRAWVNPFSAWRSRDGFDRRLGRTPRLHQGRVTDRLLT
jgi:hypothetical protein